VRICLWSGPRNVSTALLYSFARRGDVQVFDEQLYAHYLACSGAEHPGRDEVLAAQDCDGEAVVRDVVLGPLGAAHGFYKQMAHHLDGLDWSFLERTRNVVLTRDPRAMLPSLSVQIPAPTLADTGYAVQTRLLAHLEALGQDVPVVTARGLLEAPEAVLRSLCQRLGLRWDAGMLAWPSGPRSFDGVWAKHWYHAVHRSTGFAPHRPKSEPFPERLAPLLAECQPHYDALVARSIS
jgi:hypothetical protein